MTLTRTGSRVLFSFLLSTTLSAHVFAGQIEDQIKKYSSEICNHGLAAALQGVDTMAIGAPAHNKVEAFYAENAGEKEALSKILKLASDSKDRNLYLAVKSYIEVTAKDPGKSLKPSAFLSNLEAGQIKRMAAVFSYALELSVTEGLRPGIALATAFQFMDEKIRRDAIALDSNIRGEQAAEFEAALKAKIIGQDPAVKAFVETYQVYIAGLNPPGRPVGNLLYLGPTGSGKTRIVEAASEILFGTAKAVMKIDCAEYQGSQEISKLIGSPPGYLGHKSDPWITQEKLNAYFNEKLKLSIVLFDEIEKANDALWQLLLGILDKGTLTLGDNRQVDFSHSIIVMTSNIGGKEMSRNATGDGMGFASGYNLGDPQRLAEENSRTAIEAARRKFTPEFMGRLDNVVTFKNLRDASLLRVLELEIIGLQNLFSTQVKTPVALQVSEAARDKIIHVGSDIRYGARDLKRAIQRLLVLPLSSFVSSGQINMGDTIHADYDLGEKALRFWKEAQTPMVVSAPAQITNADANADHANAASAN